MAVGMLSTVDALIRWHRPLVSAALEPDLARKIEKLTANPFSFFRATYFLFAAALPQFDLFLRDAGPIVGDIHTENFGTFRSVTGQIVYDVNDFDETTESAYEYDIRRLAVSLMLAARENGHRLGDGINCAEAAVRGWIEALSLWRHFNRRQFERMPDPPELRQLLADAKEVSRAEFLQKIAAEAAPGLFVFRRGADYPPAPDAERETAIRALPFFLKHCLAPAKADPRRYRFQDVARRIAGAGSLGRHRYAVLLGKADKKQETYSSLRLIEWKQAFDSGLDSKRPSGGKGRARAIFEASCAFQLFPKRYLGYTRMAAFGMQAREIGANDRRFSHKDFQQLPRLHNAAGLFGRILARCHLLGSLHQQGPRQIPAHLHGREDRFVTHVLRFAADCAEQIDASFEEVTAQRGKLEKAWRSKANRSHP